MLFLVTLNSFCTRNSDLSDLLIHVHFDLKKANIYSLFIVPNLQQWRSSATLSRKHIMTDLSWSRIVNILSWSRFVNILLWMTLWEPRSVLFSVQPRTWHKIIIKIDSFLHTHKWLLRGLQVIGYGCRKLTKGGPLSFQIWNHSRSLIRKCHFERVLHYLDKRGSISENALSQICS